MENTCLLIVDVQKALVEKEPWQKEAFLSNLKELEEAFRRAGQEVAFVRHDDGPESESMAYGSPGWEIAGEIAPLPEERVFDKKVSSAFMNTGLEEYLKEKRISTLVIAGMQTEYCVDATVKSAFERGFSVIVPVGCVTTFDGAMFTAAQLNRFYSYEIWKNRFARVLLPAEIML